MLGVRRPWPAACPLSTAHWQLATDVSGESWGELAVAAVALLLMAVAATVEATAALISRHRLRQLAEERGRHRTLQGLLDPRRSLRRRCSWS